MFESKSIASEDSNPTLAIAYGMFALAVKQYSPTLAALAMQEMAEKFPAMTNQIRQFLTNPSLQEEVTNNPENNAKKAQEAIQQVPEDVKKAYNNVLKELREIQVPKNNNKNLTPAERAECNGFVQKIADYFNNVADPRVCIGRVFSSNSICHEVNQEASAVTCSLVSAGVRIDAVFENEEVKLLCQNKVVGTIPNDNPTYNMTLIRRSGTSVIFQCLGREAEVPVEPTVDNKGLNSGEIAAIVGGVFVALLTGYICVKKGGVDVVCNLLGRERPSNVQSNQDLLSVLELAPVAVASEVRQTPAPIASASEVMLPDSDSEPEPESEPETERPATAFVLKSKGPKGPKGPKTEAATPLNPGSSSSSRNNG